MCLCSSLDVLTMPYHYTERKRYDELFVHVIVIDYNEHSLCRLLTRDVLLCYYQVTLRGRFAGPTASGTQYPEKFTKFSYQNLL